MKLVVVGGVAGGLSFAARMRRLDESAEIVVFEKGPYPSFSNCGLPFYVGQEIPTRESLLLNTPQSETESGCAGEPRGHRPGRGRENRAGA